MEISRIILPGLKHENIHLLRLDKIHPITGGNKIFKLKYNLKNAILENKRGIISFGGTVSNHLAALAQASKENNLNSVGILRGEERQKTNSTLEFIKSFGMQLEFISRESYRLKNNSEEVKNILKKYPDYYLVPEGGANIDGVLGAMEIMNFIPSEFEYIFCSCGTGTTFAGLLAASKEHQHLIGISALRGFDTLAADIEHLLSEIKLNFPIDSISKKINLLHNYHFGGFAKINSALITFKKDFEVLNGIILDYIYTSKMLFALRQEIFQNPNFKNKKIIAIHTGGTQGNVEMEKRYKIEKA